MRFGIVCARGAQRARFGADARTAGRGTVTCGTTCTSARNSRSNHAGTGRTAGTIGRHDASDHYGFSPAATAETEWPCAAARSRASRDAYASVAL